MANLMNATKIAQIGLDAGADMVPMLMQVFVEELGQSQQQLQSCAFPELAALAHKIKGSAATFGADSLQEASNALEAYANSNQTTELEPLRSHCIEILTQTLNAYRTNYLD